MRRVTYADLGRCGRFGNACWQVASTIGLARARGVEPIFPQRWDYREFLSLPGEWYGDPDEIAAAVPAQRLALDMAPAHRNYLQSWAYVAPVLDEVRAVLQPSRRAAEILADHLRATDQTYLLDLVADAVTLHIRRGDNVNPITHPVGTWPLVTMAYYRKALDTIDPAGDGPLVIFSDNPEWCVEHVTDITGHRPGCIFVVTDGPTRPPDYEPAAYAAAPALDWIDLQLMGMFSAGHVIAASTFSLWGAVLGGGPTAYPDNWVGYLRFDQVPNPCTMVPSEWVQVHNPVGREHLEP